MKKTALVYYVNVAYSSILEVMCGYLHINRLEHVSFLVLPCAQIPEGFMDLSTGNR